MGTKREGRGAGAAGALAVAMAAAGASVLAHPGAARANERHFTFTYESATLPQGRVEVEPWFTLRHGHQDPYTAVDYRLEFEGGITDRLQGSFYLNAGHETATEGGVSSTTAAFHGASVEFKYRFLDAVADPIGLAGYLEVSYGPGFAEVEAKLIADKRFGNFLAALNIVGAEEFAREDGATETEYETEVELDLGLAYFVTPTFAVGLEARNHNNYSSEHGFEYSVVYAGPTVSYAYNRFWAAATVMPQLGALHGATGNDFRNLEDHEMVHARLLVGMQF